MWIVKYSTAQVKEQAENEPFGLSILVGFMAKLQVFFYSPNLKSQLLSLFLGNHFCCLLLVPPVAS